MNEMIRWARVRIDEMSTLLVDLAYSEATVPVSRSTAETESPGKCPENASPRGRPLQPIH